VEHSDLFSPEVSGLAVLPATAPVVYDLMGAWMSAHPEWEILRVAGERDKSADTPRFMREVAAALQFPYYFGHNWAAFRDCVNDLSWLKGASYLVIFDSAQHLLSGSPEDFGILLRILNDAHDQWRTVTTDFGALGERRMTFQSVLACEPLAVDGLIRRIRGAGAQYTLL
jgi:barstar (barnase inhibitor)